MLPWTRPDPHSDFEADALALLVDFRVDVAKGISHRDGFKNREIWKGSWKRRKQEPGLHKAALVGPEPWSAKCVWCEQLRPASRELDIEHYRPKGGVTKWEGKPLIVSDAPPPEHKIGPGYWWLAFTWQNFALACKTCNQGWKRNLFPVAGPHVACVEGVEMTEKPLLLEPGSAFRTRDHFRWDPFGTMKPVSDEGYATIVTCGLNRRELRIRREKVAHETSEVLRGFLVAFRVEDSAGEAMALNKLAKLGSRSAEFTSMVRWFTEERLGYSWDEMEHSGLFASRESRGRR